MTIHVRINGQVHSFAPACSLTALLERVKPGPGRYALELNGEVVPRSRYAQVQVRDGDVVELVQAVGGG
jgi:sulfur carrier protein